MATQPDNLIETDADEAPGEVEMRPMAMSMSGFEQSDDFDADDAVSGGRGAKVLWFAGLLSIAWLAAVAALFWLILQEIPLSDVTLTEWAAISAGVFAPLTAVWLIALVVARIDPGRGRETLARLEAAEARFSESAASVRGQVDGIDRLLVAVEERLDTLGSGLARHGAAFEETTSRAADTARAMSGTLNEDRERLDLLVTALAERGEETHARFVGLADLLPDAAERTDRIGQSLTGYVDGVNERLSALEDRFSALDESGRRAHEQALQRADDANQLLTHIDTTARDVEAQMREQADDMTAKVDDVLHRAASALEQSREGITAQAEALRSAVEAANLELNQTGNAAGDAIEGRLRALSERSERLEEGFRAQDEASAGLFTRAEDGLGSIEGRLAGLGDGLTALVTTMEGRMAWLQGEADAVGAPLLRHKELANELSENIASIRAGLGESIDTLTRRLPEIGSDSDAHLGKLRADIAQLESDLSRLSETAGALTGPIGNARHEVAASISDVEKAQGALEDSTARLRSDLADAAASLGETQRMAEDTALASASQLIDTLGRVREVAAQASETVRATLGGVVDEAVEALGKASGDAVHAATFAPVTQQIGEMEAISNRSAEAASAAAERLSRSLVSVAETAAAIEARVQEADEHLDRAQKNDLAEQSNLLIEALNSNAIDITKVLSTDVTESAWRQYQEGDRNVFTRKATRLIENADAKSIARHYEEEPEFRDAVRRYIHDFEAMMRRVMKDRSSNAFSVALLSSDVGRLYVALAQSTERLRS
ncbi:hypothetical protein KCG44_07815 [Pacificimonas sp. WHA3]|uniref:ATPase n=1 Tax=Pacificimonas pallii TaxID=2827236 RepID=A0ABS6SE99_9SPHN|nr:hypothetical protein [Pacificimonas pallii]MBV7256690.1 hypothetical protein [Pacificimonas pallii]